MKINRIDVMIKRAENRHAQFLDNNINKMMKDYGFGGVYANDFIQLNNAPETVTNILDKLKIVFERLK